MELINHLKQAMEKSEKVRPKIGGFPYLAECLRQEGFTKNTWYLPSGDSFYFSQDDSLVISGTSLIEDMHKCPAFDESLLIKALRMDQAGQTTFPEFLMNIWEAGVVQYDVNFINRYVSYYGSNGEEYREDYLEVHID
jgi:Phage envelope protein